MNQRHQFLIILSVCLIYFWGPGESRITSKNARDYFQFWVAGQGVRSMQLGSVYARADRDAMRESFIERGITEGRQEVEKGAGSRSELELAGTPVLYTFFDLLATGDYGIDYQVFKFLSISVFLIGISLLAGMLNFSSFRFLLGTFFFTHLFYPFRYEIDYGNVNLLQIGVFSTVIYLLSLRKPKGASLAAGLLSGLLFTFKPNISHALIFALYTLYLHRKFPVLKIFTVGFAIALFLSVLIPWIHFGPQCTWAAWYPTFQSIVFSPRFLEQSFLGNLFEDPELIVFQISGLLLSFLMFAYLSWDFRDRYVKKGGHHETLKIELIRNAGIGTCIYLLTGPLVHIHYFLQLIPLAFFVMRPSLPQQNLSKWSIAFFSVFVSLGLGCMAFYSQLTDWNISSADYPRLILFWGALIIFSVALLDPWLRNPVSSHAIEAPTP